MFVPLSDFPNTSALALYTFLIVQVQPVVPTQESSGFFVSSIAGTHDPIFSLVPSGATQDLSWLILKPGDHPGFLLKGDRSFPILSVHPIADAMRETYLWLSGEFPRLQYLATLRS